MAQQDRSNQWEDYYKALEGRPPRPFFLDALARCEAEATDETIRYAIDLGCGDGTETVVLLEHGWNVLAIDQEPAAFAYVHGKVPPHYRANLATRIAPFEQVVLPAADFVYAGISLPFCAPKSFDAFWQQIIASLRKGGRFAGQLFGVRDGWATDPDMTFHTDEQVRQLLTGLEIEVFQELEYDRATALGEPKHWHAFQVMARKVG